MVCSTPGSNTAGLQLLQHPVIDCRLHSAVPRPALSMNVVISGVSAQGDSDCCCVLAPVWPRLASPPRGPGLAAVNLTITTLSPRPGSSCSCSLERDILQTRGCGAPGLYTYTATHLDTWKTMFEDHFTVFCATFPRSHLHVVWPQDKIRLFGHHHTRQAW